ncbi:RES family NAD+ phosphorylase [Mangrovicoccus sp. HB161399]|uniref:RES family NAD+ phosphorylase n=1 Tax=Mangrovicoccus sp. HB161399 TaxID=2720392 RepID=UPI0015552055|nr:RES family NAD+ phosphorylase [Mangrovicoccus sp. HB161399]
MRFEITVPDPSRLRAEKAAFATIPAGTELHRIHPARFGAAAFNDTDRGNARFSPIRNARGAIIPTIYAAESFDCAAAEIILRSPDVPATDPATGRPPLTIVFPSDYAGHAHSTLATAAELTLADLTVAGQRALGVEHNALIAGPTASYPAVRAWAEAIHAALPRAQGLFYHSHQLGPAFALVLFGDRAAGALAPGQSRSVASPGCHRGIVDLADRLGIEYIEL